MVEEKPAAAVNRGKISEPAPDAPLVILPLTSERWPLLVDLFGPRGAVNGCWCMYWRIGAAYRRRAPADNRDDFRRVVELGPSPGLIALLEGEPVGWCQLTPRESLPWLQHSRFSPAGAPSAWAISCLYIRVGRRRGGICRQLVAAAIEVAREAGATAIEAYPLDAARSPSATGTGYVSTFARLGFREIARPGPARPILRLDLPVR